MREGEFGASRRKIDVIRHHARMRAVLEFARDVEEAEA
jgi:hypothetical protein